MADLAAVIDPRRALLRRQLEAGAQSAAQTPAPAQPQPQPQPTVQFTRPGPALTPEQQAMRAKQLAALLRAQAAAVPAQ